MQMFLIYCLYALHIALLQTTTLYIAGIPASSGKRLLSGGVLSCLKVCLTIILSRYALVAMGMWVVFLVLSYCALYRLRLRTGIFLSLEHLIIAVCIRYLARMVIVIAGGNSQNVLNNSVLTTTVALLLLFLIYFLLRSSGIIFSRYINQLRLAHILATYLVFIALFSLPSLLSAKGASLHLKDWQEIYSIILFVTFFFYNLMYIKNMHKVADMSQQLEIQQLYSDTLQKSVDELRGFKHDFANIISAIGGFTHTEDWDTLKDYLHNLNVEFLKINTIDIVNTEFRNTPLLYGMMLSKMSLAELGGIAFHMSIQCDLKLKYCEPVDFTRIVGILLDNAMESASSSEGKFVNFEIREFRNQYYITVENSCDEEVDVKEIFAKGYTTKPDHVGIGLSQISSILCKYRKRGYEMELRTSYSDGVFRQILVE